MISESPESPIGVDQTPRTDDDSCLRRPIPGRIWNCGGCKSAAESVSKSAAGTEPGRHCGPAPFKFRWPGPAGGRPWGSRCQFQSMPVTVSAAAAAATEAHAWACPRLASPWAGGSQCKGRPPALLGSESAAPAAAAAWVATEASRKRQ